MYVQTQTIWMTHVGPFTFYTWSVIDVAVCLNIVLVIDWQRKTQYAFYCPRMHPLLHRMWTTETKIAYGIQQDKVLSPLTLHRIIIILSIDNYLSKLYCIYNTHRTCVVLFLLFSYNYFKVLELLHVTPFSCIEIIWCFNQHMVFMTLPFGVVYFVK